MRMLRWMCNVSLWSKVPSIELNQLRGKGHVLWKDDDEWVKRNIWYEVDGERGRG